MNRLKVGVIAVLLGWLLSPCYAWSTDVSELTGITGKIGNEDIYWGTGQDNDTFSVPTYTGSTISLTKVPGFGASQESILKGVWYVSNSASITDHGNSSIQGSFAWVLAQVGSINKTKIVLPPGTYVLDSNATITGNIILDLSNGAVLSNSTSGKTLIIASPDQIVAGPDKQIFSGNVRFQNAGIIQANWFGPDSTGATDSYTAFAASIASAPVNSNIVYGPGTFLTQTQLSVTKGINLVGVCGATGTTIKAGASLTSGAMISYYPTSPSTEHLRIECLVLDGDDKAQHGLEIKNGTPMTVQDVIVKECTDRGFFVNAWGGYDGGDALPYSGIQNITFNRCHAQHNNVGFYVGRLGSALGMNFTFNDCWGYYNNFGTYFKGDNETNSERPSGFTVSWTGGSIESGPKDCYADGCDAIAMAVAFRVKDGVKLTARNVYVENYHYTNDYHYWVSADSRVDLHGANVGVPGWYSYIEDNSTICDFGPNIFDGPPYYIYAGAQGVVTPHCFGKFWDKSTFGPPNFPSPISPGYVTYHGQKFVDSSFNEWFQSTNNPDGAITGSSMYRKDRWIPKDGRIIIPFTYADTNINNKLMYINQVALIVTAVDVVITETFISSNTNNYCDGGNGRLALGVTNYPNKYISKTQMAAANLTSRNVIRAFDNDNATGAALKWNSTATTTSVHESDNHTITSTTTITNNHPAFFMPGMNAEYWTTKSNWDTNATWENSWMMMSTCPYTACKTGGFCDGEWTQGAGYIVITGYPLVNEPGL